jgi:hypothetical protein
MDPATDIKASRGLWRIFIRVRDALRQAEKFGETILHVADLQKRVADLETRLQRCPGEACPKCLALTFRVENSKPIGMYLGAPVLRHMKCQECGFEEDWKRQP